MKKEFPHNGRTFGALSDAQKWLKENGYSFGVLCGSSPIAIKKGDYLIAKWRNLSPKQQTQGIDGTITSDDWREGSVTVEIKEA